MPHLSGVFDEFPDLDKTTPQELAAFLKQKPEIHFLVNFIGNRILYPQAIPLTTQELELDLALLRKGIKLKPSLVFEPQTNKIIIPKLLTDRFPSMNNLVQAIIESINPKGVHFIFIKDAAVIKLAGSVVSPLNPAKLSRDTETVIFSDEKSERPLNLNEISFIPSNAREANIKLGGEEYKAAGGELGIIVDLRLGGFG